MIFYLQRRHRLATNAAALAVFVFGCFVFGVFSVRRTTEGVLLVAALFCVVVYWVKPEGMVGVTLFGAFAALPQGLHVGKVFGPVTIFAYQLAAVLAICYLLPAVRMRRSDFLLPGMLTLMVVFSTVVGFETGSDAKLVMRESTTMLEMIVGFVLALFVVYGNYITWAIRVMAVTLWFSAGMAIVSSFHAIRLAGRAETLRGTGAGQALRIILTTQTPATAVICALIAAAIIGRLRRATFFALGVPALIIAFLAFTRNTLIAMAVSAGVALIGGLSWSTLRRTVMVVAVAAAAVAVTVPGSLFLLHDTAAGGWLNDQLSVFNQRVLGGVSESALAVDESTQERLREDALLNHEIARAPVFGHGLGYAYQPPKGEGDDEFNWTYYPAYSHNFYLWWLAKAGAVGMAAFVVFALTPLFAALRRASAPAKISAAASAGLLAISAVWPLPEMPPDALAVGLALGAAMAFAGLRRGVRDAGQPDADRTPEPIGATTAG
ncbi:O-antigen ligase family protein [Mycobacterium sp. HUMS_1102779]|uniref:O-antigen ligase family protein n=1 Tax=Mycobacterium sp. HUMS_1102779 TaxID=3383487 RepID=UPI00389A6E51